MQKHRIYTNIGRDQKINVEISQGFDLMEILSLKFSQKDIYASGNCSEYGVVVGRISANNGFGIPNAKISIFIPLNSINENDPVISRLYPYKTVYDKDVDGYRYNLLPSRQQHGGHAPTGTFFDQQDILTREECLEVFENYYSFTVKTNSSGDFMIWGVPIGIQTLHVDIDLSDIGCFSLRPYDFIKKGVGIDNFERVYKFKSSVDIDGLPQIVSFDQTIDVYPFWGNEELCEIGITRSDFDLSDRGIKIEPISLILMSSITDDNGDAVKRNGKIRKNSGYKCNLQTTGGKIECVRETGRTVYASDGVTRYPELEFFNITEVIDDNGVAMTVLPMNMEYVYTNEFGNEEITNDSNKGIPTTAIARFRFSLDFDDRKHAVGKYLVPNIREFNPDSNGVNDSYEYYEGMVASYQFSDVFEDYITPPTGITLNSTNYGSSDKANKKELMLGTNNNGIPEDYFYKFIFGKVYTVSSFQGTHSESSQRDAFLGIKQIRPNVEEDCSSKSNYFPTNFAFKNRTKFNLILSQVLLFFQFLFSIILMRFAELLGKFFYGLSKLLYNIGIRRWRPFRKISQQFEDNAYGVQGKYTKQLPLTIYPDCEECTSDDETTTIDSSFVNDYCRVAELLLQVRQYNEIINYDFKPYVYVFMPDEYQNISFFNKTTDVSLLGNESDTVNKIFPGEYAKDNEGECTGSTTLNYYELSGLTLSGITQSPPDYTTARFIASVYPYAQNWSSTGTTLFTEFVGFFTTDDDTLGDLSNIRLWNWQHPTAGYWYTTLGTSTTPYFTYSEWNELTGMDYENLPVVGNYDPDSTGLNSDTYTAAVLRIYDRSLMKASGSTDQDLTIETGCYKYDKTYDESITLGYLWMTGNTYGSLIQPRDPSGLPDTNFASYADAPGFREYLKASTPDPSYNNLASTLIASTNTLRMPYKKWYSKIPNATYERKTKSGFSEFRDGVFTLIPVIKGRSYNLKAIQEWYRRKRVGLMFCGGVVNYSFIDNWLNGVLYFFKFDKRVRWDNESNYDLNQRGSKFPRELVFFNILDKNFYYRSTPYFSGGFIGQSNTYDSSIEILHPTTFYDVGVRDEFLYEICTDPRVDPTCSVIRDIGPTSYQDPANIVEYGINYRLDIKSAKFDVDDFFSGSQNGSNIKVFDGDITQLMSINCEAGIEAFDIDSPHYFMYNGEIMDPESDAFGTTNGYFKNGSLYGPTPIDLKFDFNGGFIRGCLNYRLGDYSQVVPFYLWDKSGTGNPGTTAIGFGNYGDSSDDQKWDRSEIASMKLQRLFSISGITAYDYTHSNYIMSNGEEEYLLKPMTIDHDIFWFSGDWTGEDALERFDVISWSAPSTSYGEAQNLGYIEGDLWLRVISGSLKDPQSGYLYAVVNRTWVQQSGTYFDNIDETFMPQTVFNYWGNKQVLSTPFLFYFGLRPEKTALDLLIKYFGPKGAFLSSVPIICPNPGGTPTPSATPAASLLPYPSASITPSPTPILTMTPTPTPTPQPYSYRANLYGCSAGVCGSYITNIEIYNPISTLSINYFYKLPGGGQIIEITSGPYMGGGSPYTLQDGDKWPTCNGACSS